MVSPYDLGLPGGVQDQAERLVGWIREAGHEATLLGPGVEGPEGATLFGATMSIPANRSRAPVKLDPRIIGRVRRAVGAFDAVHIHEPLVPSVSLAAMSTPGVAKVGTFHADPSGWVRGLYRYGRAALRLLLGGIDVFTAVSPVAASPLDGVVEYRIIPNGIDVGEYKTGPKEQGRVTFVGRDEPRKGLSVLLEAWPQVLAAVPGSTLHVVGAKGPEGGGVRFLGRVNEEEKRRELAAAVVHCAPNLGGESFGISGLEAMAAGCAVVASALPGFEYVAGSSGAFVAPGDAGALADAVIRMLTEPDRAADAGTAARERALEFDGPVVAGRYLAAYEDAIGARNAKEQGSAPR